MSSLYSGISGLNAMQMQLDVIGNNIANSNTVGYKASRILFADILSQSLTGGGGGTLQIGRGVTVGTIGTSFGAGSFEPTDSATDLSIDGDGFFMVRDDEGGVYYTRAGAFNLDEEGFLVDINGYMVQGRNLMSDDPMAVGNISVRDVASDPRATTELSIGANLDSTTMVGDVFTVAQTVYDTLGTSHTLRIEFERQPNSPGVTGDWLATIALVGAGENGADIYAPGDTYVYEVGDYVRYDGGFYVSTAETSGAWNADDWNAVPPHEDDVEYAVDASVVHDGRLWVNNGDGPITGAVNPWEAVVDVDDVDDWETGTYVAGDIVANGGSFWIADVGTSEEPTGDPDDWTEILAHATGTAYAADAYAVVDDVIYRTSGPSTGEFNPWEEVTVAAYNDGTTFRFTFGPDGGLTSPTGTVNLDFRGLASEAEDVNIDWQLTGIGVEPLTGYAATSVTKSLIQNGYSSGDLRSISVTENGTMIGFFTNGQTGSIAQVMLASFSNPIGLQRMGANLFGETLSSGVAIQNAPGEGGMGTVISSALELSNADIAREFINMITAQRAYQASAKVVTTTDQMMQELMNIKR